MPRTGVLVVLIALGLKVAQGQTPTFSEGAVVNATGYQSKLAPDTVFTIFGNNLGPAALLAAAGPNYPVNLGGTSVTFTPAGGGASIAAKMVYTVAGQLAGLLPSAIVPGGYAVRVTYNSVSSAPRNVSVVARSFGIATANSAGTGTAQATIGNINGGASLVRFTSGTLAFNGINWALSPAHPGDTLVLWGTGGGADPANDSGGTSGDQTKAGNFSVTLGGRQVTPLYAGASSGYPGLWQINFVIPPDITPGCFVSAQVSAGGENGNTVNIPIATAGSNACSDPQLSSATLANLDAGGTVKIAGFGVSRGTNTFTSIPNPGAAPTVINGTQESIAGFIAGYTAAQYAALFGLTKIGACLISDVTAPNGSLPTTRTFLDLGPNLPVAGPKLAANAALARNSGPTYSLVLTNGTITNGGTYTLNAPGGNDTGPFSASVNFPSSFSVTNWNALNLIDRGKPLVLNWTGGEEEVFIIISASRVLGKDATNTNIIHNVGITCEVPAAPGTYTVPVEVLAFLLPETLDAASLATGAGSLGVEAVNINTFKVPLKNGGQVDYAALSAVDGVSKNLVIQ